VKSSQFKLIATIFFLFAFSNAFALFEVLMPKISELPPKTDNPANGYNSSQSNGSTSNQEKKFIPPESQSSEPESKSNNIPSAVDDFGYSVNSGNTLFGIDAKANDSDPDGDEISIISASSENADVKINPDGTLDYKPKEGFQGSDRIYYKISDGKGGTAEGRVHIEVKPSPASSPENNNPDKQSTPETEDAQVNPQNDGKNQSDSSNEPKAKNEEDSSFFGLPFKNPFSSERMEPAKEEVKETIKKSKDIYKETVKEIKQEIKDFGCKFVYEKYIIEKKVPKSYPSSHNWNNWSSFDIKQYEDLILGCK